MVASPTIPRNAERAQSGGRAEGKEAKKARPRGIIEAGIIHLASLQRRIKLLREYCYNVVTRASTVGNDSVVPDSKRERSASSLCSS
jgi:hypothetical protein